MLRVKRQFSSPKAPQYNGVLKRKNQTIQEASITILNEAQMSNMYWREVYITVYILNTRQLIVNNDKTPNELWYGRPALVKHLILFGSKCYIKRNEDDLCNFDSRTDEGIFLGYSSTKKTYKCYNQRLHKIIESADVRVDDIKPRRIKSQG